MFQYLCRSLSIFCLIVISGCSSLAGKQLIGKEPPAVRLYRIEDNAMSFLPDYKGKYVVLAFWATTCRASGPIMKRLGSYALEHARDDSVKIFAVSLDKLSDISEVKRRIIYDRLEGMDHLFSGNEEFDEAFFGLKGERLPYVVVIDPSGKVIGVDTDDDIVYSLIGKSQGA